MGNRICLTAVVVVLAGMAGCSSTPEEGTFPCDVDSECPTDWFCRADERCWSTPDGNDAGLDAGDASGTDATTADAPTSPDAPPGMDAPESLDGSMDASSSDTGGLDSSAMSDDVPASTDGGLTDVPGAGSDTGVDAGRDGGAADGGADAGVDAGGPCGGLPMTTFYRDLDGDMHGAAASGTMLRCAAGGGFVATNDDCDDGNPGRYPGATELCNNVDDDCNGSADGTAANPACVVANGTGVCLSGGTCDIASCGGTFDDCDAVIANGCETDTSTASPHCAACGSPCGAADTCSASSCDLSPVVQVEPRQNNSCLRRANGHVACWGLNNAGALGTGSTTPASSATPIEIPGITSATDIAIGAQGDRACSVLTSGEVWCWGYGAFGAPGGRPGAVAGISDAAEIDIGFATTCARRATGRVACWSSTGPVTNVPGITDAVNVDVQDDDTFCAVRATGAVLCWGPPPLSATPAVVPSMTGVTNAARVATASGGACVLTTTGNVDCYTLPTGTGDFNSMPRITGAVQLTSGSVPGAYGTVICARLTSGTTVCYGSNAVGQFGNSATGSSWITTPTAPTGAPLATYIGAGSGIVCLATPSGVVTCWGQGNAYYVNSTAPTYIPGL